MREIKFKYKTRSGKLVSGYCPFDMGVEHIAFAYQFYEDDTLITMKIVRVYKEGGQ